MRAYEAAKALHEFGNEHSPSSYVLIAVTLRTHLSSFQRAHEKILIAFIHLSLLVKMRPHSPLYSAIPQSRIKIIKKEH